MTSISRKIANNYERYSEPFVIPFAVFVIINHPMFYFIWRFLFGVKGESLFLRVLSGVLCVPLLFKGRIAGRLEAFFPIYWYFVLMFCLPFLTTYSFLQNTTSPTWMANVVLGVLLLTLVVDWLSFFFVMLGGTTIAVVCFYYSSDTIELCKENILSTVVNITWTLFAMFFFYAYGIKEKGDSLSTFLSAEVKDIKYEFFAEIKEEEDLFSEFNLSAAEKKCCKYIIQGMTSKKIARELGISPRTVEVHTDRIKSKLGVHYKHELIEYFYEHNPRIKFILSV